MGAAAAATYCSTNGRPFKRGWASGAFWRCYDDDDDDDDEATSDRGDEERRRSLVPDWINLYQIARAKLGGGYGSDGSGTTRARQAGWAATSGSLVLQPCT